MRRVIPLMAAGFVVGVPSAAVASDTVTYSYDALGRLVATSVSGGPNAGITTGTSFDPAGNRSSYSVSGAGSSLRAAPSNSNAGQPTPPLPPFRVFVLSDN